MSTKFHENGENFDLFEKIIWLLCHLKLVDVINHILRVNNFHNDSSLNYLTVHLDSKFRHGGIPFTSSLGERRRACPQNMFKLDAFTTRRLSCIFPHELWIYTMRPALWYTHRSPNCCRYDILWYIEPVHSDNTWCRRYCKAAFD